MSGLPKGWAWLPLGAQAFAPLFSSQHPVLIAHQPRDVLSIAVSPPGVFRGGSDAHS